MGILDLNNIKEALQIAGKIEFYPQILEMREKLHRDNPPHATQFIPEYM